MSFNLLCHCLHQLDLQILWVRSSYLWLIDISVLFGLHCLIMVSWRQSLPSHTSKYSTTGNWEESRLITADLGVYEASVQMWSGPVLKQQQSLGVGVTQLTSILHETYTEIPGSEDSVSVVAKEATIGLGLSLTEVWYEPHLHFLFYCSRPLKQLAKQPSLVAGWGPIDYV